MTPQRKGRQAESMGGLRKQKDARGVVARENSTVEAMLSS